MFNRTGLCRHTIYDTEVGSVHNITKAVAIILSRDDFETTILHTNHIHM